MEGALEAVFQSCKEHNFNIPITGRISESFEETVSSYENMGFQATNLASAIEIFKLILLNKSSKKENPVTLYLSISYNLIFSPVRDCVAFLIRRNIVDVLVVSGGVIEADVGLLLGGSVKGALKAFEEWFRHNIFNELLIDHTYSPSEFCSILGKTLELNINSGEFSPSDKVLQNSVTYWAWKHDVPIFVPSWSDGTIAEILCGKTIVVDLVSDILSLNRTALHASQSAMIIIGGGIPKHHTCNANLMRNGADYAIYLNTAQEYDGSDTGASPDEAISWGKIKADARHVKVNCDARISLPIIISKCLSFKE